MKFKNTKNTHYLFQLLIHKTECGLTHTITALINIRYITNYIHGNTQKISRVPLIFNFVSD